MGIVIKDSPPYIGYFIQLSQEHFTTDLFFIQIMEGLTKAAEKNGYHTVILPNYPEQQLIDHNIPRELSGAVIFNPTIDHRLENLLQTQNIPFVIIGTPNSENSSYSVDIDVVGAAYQITQMLFSRGHRKICFVNTPKKLIHSAQQKVGFIKAHEDAGIPWEERLYLEKPISEASGIETLAYIQNSTPECSAVVTVNEITAKGLVDALQDQSIRIPKKMAVTSMGGTPISLCTRPQITTIDYHPLEIGKTATELLIEVMGKKRIRPNHIILPTTILERGSS